MVEMGNLFKAETELIDKIRELMIEMQPKLSKGLKMITEIPPVTSMLSQMVQFYASV